MEEVVNCLENTISQLVLEINELTKKMVLLQEEIEAIKCENNILREWVSVD